MKGRSDEDPIADRLLLLKRLEMISLHLHI
jgi:hypothetical protein